MARIPFHDLPIRHKLRRVALSVIIALGVIVLFDHLVDEYLGIHHASQDKMAALAAVLGRSSAAGILFNDPREVDNDLALAREVPSITSATISLPDGTVFARYEREDAKDKAPPGVFTRVYSISQPILLEHESIGRIDVEWELREEFLELLWHLLIDAFFVAVVATLVILLLDRLIQGVTAPITLLSRAVREMGRGDLSMRVEVTSKDEVGELAASFNQMADSLKLTTVSRDELAKEAEERKKAEKALLESENKYRALVEGINDWVWEVDENGVFTYSSPQVHKIAGYGVEEVLGKTPFDFMRTEEAGRVAEFLRAAASAQKPFKEFENLIFHKNGYEVVVEMSAVPYSNAEGRFIGYRGIIRDITERYSAEEALHNAHEELLEKTGRLVRFNKMAVGREQRIMKLKGEVNELLARVGEPKRYEIVWKGGGHEGDSL